MASTPEGRALTEQHRQSQIAVRAAFLAAFLPLWPLLAWADLDGAGVAWVRAVMELIRSFRQDSANLSAGYYRQFREVEAPRARLAAPLVRYQRGPQLAGRVPDVVEPFFLDPRPDGLVVPIRKRRAVDPAVVDWSRADRAAERSMLVTGPIELKRRAGRGESEDRAKAEGLKIASAAGSRHVLNGGRETFLSLVQADERVLGWARVTDSDPCSFCALLASRGPVYRSPVRAGFRAHDGCACTAEAVFASRAAWPGRAREFQRLYYASTRGQSGKDAIRAFRRAHDAKRREAAGPDALTA